MKRLKDVALLAGVSEGTASLALNNKPGVNAKTQERVLKAAQEIGYTPNTIARGLARRKSNNIGLVVTDIENPFFGSVIRFIDENLRDRGYNLTLSLSNDLLELEDASLLRFISDRVDGVLVVPTVKRREDFAIFESLSTHKIPYVFVTSFYPAFDSDVVMADLEEGAYILTKYLLDLGHRDIMFFTTEVRDVLPSKIRMNGYLKAFKEAGIEPCKDAIVGCHKPDFFYGYSNAKKVLQTRKPDAIMGINDILALGVKKAAMESGYNIPQDISVAGFDDVIFSSISQTPITTVRQDIPAMCFEAVQTLINLIKGGQRHKHHTFMPVELIVRKSTGKASVEGKL